MALCRVTGTLYLPSGEPAAGYNVYLTSARKKVVPDYLGSVVPEVVKVQASWNGEVDFEILSGEYHGVAGSSCGGKGFQFSFLVPEADSVDFQDCLDAIIPDPPPPAWLERIEAVVAAAESAARVSVDASEEVESALNGGPWQVVATDAVTGKAEARDLTTSVVLDLDSYGEIAGMVVVPTYGIDENYQVIESKGVPLPADVWNSANSLVRRDSLGRFQCATPSPDNVADVTNKYYVDGEIDKLRKPLAAVLSLTYPIGVANPASAEPQSHLAIGGGAQARHTSPGQYNGGGVACGVQARLNGLHHLAFGPLSEVGPRNASDTYDLTMPGTNHSVAFGGATVVSVDNGAAIGARAKVTHYNSVALGADSDSTAANTVSVGSATIKRRVTNVANPTGNNDAANKVYVDGRLSAAQRTAINALSPIADTATATTQQVATLLNSLIAALKA